MLWNSGRSLPLPAYSVVATLNCVTCLPDASARISGSRVRRPARSTLFMFQAPFRSADGSRADPACGGSLGGEGRLSGVDPSAVIGRLCPDARPMGDWADDR